jgi:polyphosphate glucokinase
MATWRDRTRSEADAVPQRVGLGIDVGGTGIKAALVDLETGQLIEERLRMPTPQPATYVALRSALQALVAPVIDRGEIEAVGIGFPAIVRRGVVLSNVNMSIEWLYADMGQVFSEALGRQVWALNDTDAAAFAEARVGAARHERGTVVVTTLGTGVGTGLVVDGQLVPNVELGLLTVRGKPAGMRVSNRTRREKKLTWQQFACDLGLFVDALDQAVAPDLVVVGGGISSQAHRYLPLIRCRPMLMPARLRNQAGLVGSALYAADQQMRRRDGEHMVSQLFPVQRQLAPQEA